MTDEPNDPQNPQNTGPAGEAPDGPPQLTPEEQEMLEQQMKEIRVEDLLTQTVASVLNLSARRIVKEDEVDLDQARIGIEAVRALVGLLPPEVETAVREPLAQVQMLYAQRAGGGAPGEPDGGSSGGEEPPQQPPQPGGSGLWTPGS